MAKRASVKAAEPPPEEDISQEVDDLDETQETHEPEHQVVDDKPMSKAAAVRAAMATGLEFNADIVEYVRKEHGLDVPSNQISSYKQQARNREAKNNGEPVRTRSPRTPAAANHTVIPQGLGAAIKEVRELMEKLGGPEETKELIGQLNGLISKYGAGGLGEIIDALG